MIALPETTSTPNEPLLRVEHLEVRYGQITAVRDLSFTVRAGECVALLGPNGAGKSSTLKAISGLVRPAKGEVSFLGRRIDHDPAERIARMGMSHVPEGRGIFPDLTVRENLRMPTGRVSQAAFEDALERVHGYFPRLAERAHQLGGTLSGGEQQQLAIGRALMVTPALLLLDEMSLGLAPTIVEQLFGIIRRINADGVAVLVVEQYVGQALAIADTAIVLEKGTVRASGTASALAADATVVQASYLGAAGAGGEKPQLVGAAYSERIAVQVPSASVRQLTALAAARGMSLEELGREAIERLLTTAEGNAR